MITLPESFISSLQHCKGFDEDPFVAAHHSAAPVSIRINEEKMERFSAVFSAAETDGAVPWCPHAHYLKERPLFTLDPAFHAGTYYVQEASSMFIHHALEATLGNARGLSALDLCAAPGGKSTLLASMPQFSLVLANEIIQGRVAVLQENLIKWGAHHTLVSNNDPRDFERLGAFFDVVLVDAPCSGSGLFRKDHEAVSSWSTDQVSFCAARQQRILTDILPALKEGGILLYSTCSFSRQENEDNLDYLMQSGQLESLQLPFPEEWGIVPVQSDRFSAHGYRFYPDRLRGEGFFCAVFRKNGPETPVEPSAKRLVCSHDPGIAGPWIQDTDGLVFFQKENEVFALPEVNQVGLGVLQQQLRLRRSALRLGVQIRNGFVPDHELAMSLLWSASIDRLQLDKLQALDYLRRESIGVDLQSNGWKLVCYGETPLGWAKIVQGKMKNHYPMNWRILMRK
jgi:16S rRNA C967 or C1407 C5-methylase (RsmB/RsmF family)/NOL1/NOP2/fmu family ribosome biogenesis protein